MSAWTLPSQRLSHAGALAALAGAVAHAERIGVPQNIAVVDDGGNLLAFVRMSGAKLLSRETCISKAVTAASHRQPTARLDRALEVKLALATVAAGGRLTNLEGGLPILFGGVCVGGIGVGSGTGTQDIAVARAALAALGADEVPE